MRSLSGTGQSWQYQESYFSRHWDPTSELPQWVYRKDIDALEGLDKGFLDNLQQRNVSSISATWAGTQPWVSDNWLWTTVGCLDPLGGNSQLSTPPFSTPCAQSALTKNENPASPTDSVSFIESTIAGPNNIAFDYRVSSEPGYDFLKVFVDGIEE